MDRLSAILIACSLWIAASPTLAEVIDFQDLVIPPSGYFNGDSGTLSPGQSVAQPWLSGGVSFANLFGIDS